ncbi:MAG: aminopeptidase N, partial [Pseudomonadota bacterium]
MKTETGQAIRLVDYRPFPFEIPHIDLTFDLNPEATIVQSRLDVVPRDGEAPGTPLVLDGVELTLRSIAINGTPLQEGDYLYKDDKLIVHSPPAQPFVLETEVTIHPGQNKTLMGLYVSNDFLCTQCEAEGFRRITFFADRPDVLSVYTVTLIASQKAAPILLANGNATDRGTKEEGKHWVRWTDPFPKPAYLFALVAGDLAHIDDQFTTQSGRQVTLQIFVEHGKEDRCAYAMDALKRSMAWDEEAFGLEYDLDIFMIVAVSAFNFGAMENKGLNIFNDKLILASPETATDADYEGIESVIAHEYFHNWTGNRITCRDWFQLCLKEGLTVYRDQRFTEDMREPTVARIDSVQQLRARQFREDGGPLAHPVRPSSFVKIDNFYTSTVYEKGAELCRMLATLAGIEGFRAGIALYFERHDGTAATVEAFLDAIFDANGGTLGGIDAGRFLDWYTQAGTPTVSVATLPTSEGNDLHLKLAQDTAPSPGEPNKKPLPIPLRLALIDPDGAPVPLELQADQAMVDGPSKGGGDVVIV